MEMEGELTWKALFQRRVVMADAHCHNLLGILRGLLDVLDGQAWPEMVAGAEETRRKLEAASTELGLAIANMGAARHLAPRGEAPRAWAPAPLDSVDDIDPRVWLVHIRLQDAAEIARRVHDRMETTRVHMDAAELLAVLEGDSGGGDDDNAPWVHDLSTSEQINGFMELAEALNLAVDLVDQTATARDEVF
ncbi:hypothetical protein E2562_036846 [Oryza meyeriana var. granulata]|uniref:Uncharacterized protein n=1 Tax=Oryza meyeriana var. granulata TaxID=110450 RepID=A0A6G1E9Z0_9ORYZ|nr:hypothetical protein E2562_036846 [Oryza meyeriana var. granulata]